MSAVRVFPREECAGRIARLREMVAVGEAGPERMVRLEPVRFEQ